MNLPFHSISHLRTLGKGHFLARSRKRLAPDAFDRLRRELDETIQVPTAVQDAPLGEVSVNGYAIPVFDAPRPMAGEPLLESAADGGTKILASVIDGRPRFGFDFWASQGAILTGDYEPNGAGARGRSSVPIVDMFENRLFESLAESFGPLRPSWPNGARFALGLSHDVDRTRKTFQFVTHGLREISRGHLKRALAVGLKGHRDAYWCFDGIQALERKYGVSSTFFFLHETPEGAPAGLRERLLLSGACRLDDSRVREQVRRLSDSGWEIGLHSSSYAPGHPLRLRREKELLEGIVGHPVMGVRQHLLASHVSTLWPDQEALGFRYDSTMGFATSLGFRSGTSHPYPVAPEGLLEIPFQIMDGALRNAASTREDECLRQLEMAASAGGALVLLWHQRFFNDNEFPGFSALYERLIQTALARGAWVAPLGQIADWWKRSGP